jgi:GWxTD domain-containing protein
MKNLAVILISLFIAGGCAARSRVALHPDADPAANNLCGEFLETTWPWITQEEKREIRSVRTREQCEAFLAQFWNIRDPNPATPENELKQILERRVSDIKNEEIAKGFQTSLVRFENNGGWNGDMAQVYLLHGAPTAREKITGRTFVDLMLWIYADERGRHEYRFLFYNDGDFGEFKLLFPFFSIEQALEKISKFPLVPLGQGSPNYYAALADIYDEIVIRGNGYIYPLAMTEFSDYGTAIAEALEPPTPASIIAERSSEIVLEALPEIFSEKLFFENPFGAIIPMEYAITRSSKGALVAELAFRYGDLDWVDRNEQHESDLSIVAIAQHHETLEVYIQELSRTFIAAPETLSLEMVPAPAPAGTYRVTVHVRNTVSHKYGTVIENISIP